MAARNPFAEYISPRLSRPEKSLALKIAVKLAQQNRGKAMTRREIARDAGTIATLAGKLEEGSIKAATGARYDLIDVAKRYNATAIFSEDLLCRATDSELVLCFDDMLAPRIPLPPCHPAHKYLFVA